MLSTQSPINPPVVTGRPGAMHPWARSGLIVLCWLIAILLGAVNTWAFRHSMSADGMSYLDLADAWRTGQWADAVNAYWSPLYSWLLAVALIAIQPSEYWEAAVAHLVIFAGYLLALGCFHYFWTGLRRWAEDRWSKAGRAEESAFAEWAWITVGYALCIWVLLDWVTIDEVTPDMYVAAFAFLDAGLLVRIREGRAGWGLFVILGISLGLGYLTKAILLPMAAVFAVTALLASPRWSRAIPRLLLTAVVFAVIAGPWVYALTKSKGRFTTGDAGKLNYAFIVNEFHPWDVWQGEPPPANRAQLAAEKSRDNDSQGADGGRRYPARSPVRWLLDKPHVFEFAEPRPGTYPVWYDPSYWHEGAKPYFDLDQQLRVLSQQLGVYFEMLSKEMGAIAFVLLCLLLVRGKWWGILRDLFSLWWVAMPALAALGAFALVRVENRYVGPFVVLLWAALLPLARLPRSEFGDRLTRCAAAVMLIGLVSIIGYNSAAAWKQAATDARYRRESRPNQHWITAQEMAKAGLRAGDHVGHIGQAVRSWSYWARLAKVRITAELRPSESFWLADDETRNHVLDVFRNAGEKKKLRAVITRKHEDIARPFGLPYDFAPGWQRIPRTQFYIRFLDTPASAPASQPATQGAG